MSDEKSSTEEARALWAKLYALGAVGPRDGLLTSEGNRLIHRIEFSLLHPKTVGWWFWAGDGKSWRNPFDAEDVLDFDDPGTLGCLLGMAREAWGDPLGWCALDMVNGLWQFWVVGRSLHWSKAAEGPTEALALLRAIEAAPVKP